MGTVETHASLKTDHLSERQAAPDRKETKRLQTDESPSGPCQATRDINSNNCSYDQRNEGLETPPHDDSVKNKTRIVITMKPRNPIKKLFPATSTEKNASTSASMDIKHVEKKRKKNVCENNPSAIVCAIDEASGMEKPTVSNPRCPCFDHAIFLCDCERGNYNKDPTDIADGAIATNIWIPGSTAEMDLLTTRCYTVIDGMIKAVTRSHHAMVSYNGNLSMRNFRCNNAGEVKLDQVEILPRTNSAVREDKKRTATLIRQEIFRDRVVPTGIEKLLLLMESEDAHNNGELVECHASRQPSLKRTLLYEILYRRFMGMKRSDPKKYKAVADEFKSKVDFGRWQNTAMINRHLTELLHHKNPVTGLQMKYDETPEGLLHYAYNGVKHLTDKDYEQGALQFQDYEVDHIVFGTYPGLLEALQEAMFAHGGLFKLE